MVEVFKTNIKDVTLASKIVKSIHTSFATYKANFDLEDCDNILRIESVNGPIEMPCLIKLLNEHGCEAKVLMDSV